MVGDRKAFFMAYTIIGITLFFVVGALLLFLSFLYVGGLGIVPLGMGVTQALWFNGFLSIIFFFQHSFMIRRGVHEWLERFISAPYHGTVYALASGVTLLSVTILWQKTPGKIVELEGVAELFARFLFFLAIVGFFWGAKTLKSLDLVGRHALLGHLRGKKPRRFQLAKKGPYLYVRHPFYFLVLVMIWSSSEITHDRLLFNCMWSLWILLGTYLEELDMVVAFGDSYREYQRRVPMLIPWRGRCSWK